HYQDDGLYDARPTLINHFDQHVSREDAECQCQELLGHPLGHHIHRGCAVLLKLLRKLVQQLVRQPRPGTAGAAGRDGRWMAGKGRDRLAHTIPKSGSFSGPRKRSCASVSPRSARRTLSVSLRGTWRASSPGSSLWVHISPLTGSRTGTPSLPVMVKTLSASTVK